MQVAADGTKYLPPGQLSCDSEDGAVVLDTDLDDEKAHAEWTRVVFPNLGNSLRGAPFAEQRGIKFVESVTLNLIEDDAAFTLGDDCGSVTFSTQDRILGNISTWRPLPDKRFSMAGSYHHRGGSVSHDRAPLSCATTDDCDQALVCSGSTCQVGVSP